MTRRWHPVRLLTGLCLLALVCGPRAKAQDAEPPRQRLTIGYVEIEGDVRYEPIKAYERLILKVREHPLAGAQIGLDDAKVLARVLKTDFALERITVKSAAEVAPAVQQAMTSRDIHFFIVDAPAVWCSISCPADGGISSFCKGRNRPT